MRRLLLILLFALFWSTADAQVEIKFEKGSVSFVSSQNVYVKFESTNYINTGDTLYGYKEGQLVPALVVSNKSSISCVCTPVDRFDKFEVGATIVAKRLIRTEIPVAVEENVPLPVLQEAANEPAPPPAGREEEDKLKQDIAGRISVATFSHMDELAPIHRMRYSFSMRSNHIKNSRFSADCNIVFRHTIDDWAEVQDNIFNALKIYALSGRYDFRHHFSLSLGRKINNKISSMGAIDGLQLEKGLGNFSIGLLAGSRPNIQDFSFDPTLLQEGIYASHSTTKGSKYQQSTLAIVDQRNHLLTDRRFIYFQHGNSLVQNLNIFGSFEVDLFEKINEEAKNTFHLTNLFVSLNYRVSQKLSLSSSYDSRRNIIYYESYKNYIDQLIEDETRQGLRFGFNLRPFKMVTLGANASWRFQKSGDNDSKNLNAFLNYSRVPLLNISASLTANILSTGYLDSKMFGLRLSKDLLKGKLNTELYARIVNYQYKQYEYSVQQYIGGMSVNFRLARHTGLYLYYEGTLDDQKRIYHLFNTKVMQRF